MHPHDPDRTDVHVAGLICFNEQCPGYTRITGKINYLPCLASIASLSVNESPEFLYLNGHSPSSTLHDSLGTHIPSI